ncbi:MAG: hypothetical protein PF440_03195 [Thiomicrorhabdus sp.]|jgi:hypothetical protein|nr:hypothetical protein [Thiomicrorhabdus sp.]
MAMPCSEESYNRLIDEDIEWLKEQFKDKDTDEHYSLELSHVIIVLERSKETYAECVLPNIPHSVWDC